MPVYLLSEEPFFPPVSEAEPDGLLAVGGDFSPNRLIQAYASGIFPWFEQDGDIFWFSPDPRMVLFPGDIHISDSLRRILKKRLFEVRYDTAFEEVIRECAGVSRRHEQDTWISEPFIQGYTELHRLGLAHSVEAWKQGRLAGGLYGVSLGAAFFGESMFHLEPDASKVAFVHLAERLAGKGFTLIDCQVETAHLIRMGAGAISRERYLELLKGALGQPTWKGPW